MRSSLAETVGRLRGVEVATAAAALTAAENRWTTGGAAIAAVVAVLLAVVVLRSQRPTASALGCGSLAVVTCVACGGIIGWLATPYSPDGTLDDLVAGFGGGGGVSGVVFGMYLWLPVGVLAVVAWLACRRAVQRGRAGGLGLSAGVTALAVSALTMTVSDRPPIATALMWLGATAGLVVIAAEIHARAHARRG